MGQTVRLTCMGLDPPDLELDPIALLEVVDTAVERQQEREAMIRRGAPDHIISSHDINDSAGDQGASQLTARSIS